MGSKRSDFRRWISEEDVGAWPSAEALALPTSARADYERKLSAIKQYAAGAPLRVITSTTEISRQYLYYLIDRCQMPGADGRPIGFLALVKGKHLPKPRRSSLVKLSAGRSLPGALQGLFLRYPELHKIMIDLIARRRMPGSKRMNHRLTWSIIHDIFEEECIKLGILPPNYPFCSESAGFVALTRWGRKLRQEQERKADLVNALQMQDDVFNSLLEPPSRCYQRVQCDGHHVDLNWIIEVPGLNGEGVVRIKVTRLWLIPLLETKSSAIIGYSVSLNYKNYSSADVARAVRSSLVPWTPRQLSISTIAYKPGECLPNALDPRLSYLCYDELWLDNAKSHMSELFLSVLERTVNAVPVIGPRDAPNARPQIEAIFDLLEEAGIHPLDGTTGANPNDPRKATKRDGRYLLKLELVLDLIDLLVVRYNTGIAPGTTISRLEVLQRAVARETTVFRQLPIAQREACLKYDLFEVTRIGSERGRAILRWHDARYFGAGLLSQPGLVGQEVLVMASSMDLRKIEIFLTADGTPLGILDVERRWRSTPHTLWTRRQVRKAMTNSGFLRHAADIPRAFRKHVEDEAKRDARQKSVLAQLAHEQQVKGKSAGAESEDRQGSNVASISTYAGIPSTCDERAERDPQDPIELENDELDEILQRLGTVYR